MRIFTDAACKIRLSKTSSDYSLLPKGEGGGKDYRMGGGRGNRSRSTNENRSTNKKQKHKQKQKRKPKPPPPKTKAKRFSRVVGGGENVPFLRWQLVLVAVKIQWI